MVGSSFTVVDRGLEAIVKELLLAGTDNSYVAVGVLQDTKHEGDGVSLVNIATWNEYGTANGHIPERSFMRGTYANGKEEIASVQRRAAKGVASGQFTIQTGLTIIGQKFQAMVRKRISSSIPPPNAPSTIAKKGSSTTLIDTGQLRQAINYEVKKRGGA